MGFIRRHSYIFVAGLALSLVLLAWMANYFLLSDNSERGTFGDMFGGLNALFSGFAFVGVILAILMQSAELKLQREELAETREVLADQKEQLEAQSKTLIKQNFENTFFQLVQYYDAVLLGIGKDELTGKPYLVSTISNYTMRFINEFGRDNSVDVGSASKFSEVFFGARVDTIDTLFKTVLTILDFIEYSEVENKYFYVAIFKSKMSNLEFKALFYYGFIRNSPLRNSLEKFCFFSDLKNEHLCNSSLFNLYAPNAFRKVDYFS